MGEYDIYTTDEEAKRKLKGKKYFIWGVSDPHLLKIGDYIQTLDGFYVPCLDFRKMKTISPAFDTWFVRVPQGSFWMRRFHETLTFKFAKLFGFLTPLDAYSASGKAPNQRFVKNQDASNFVSFLMAGLSPDRAYRMTYPYKSPLISKQIFKRKVANFMKSEEVLTELRTRTEAFKDLLQKEFPLEELTKELAMMLKSARKGSMSHLEIFKFIAEATGSYEDSSKKGKVNPREVEKANFSEVAPPKQIK